MEFNYKEYKESLKQKRPIKYKNTKRIFVDFDTFNEKLKESEEYCTDTYEYEKPDSKPFAFKRWIWSTKGVVHLAYKIHGKGVTYMLKLDGTEDLHTIQGRDAYRGLCISAKPQKTIDYGIDPKSLPTCSGLKYKNKKFSLKTTEHCYTYDLKSAWGASLAEPIPDLNTMRKDSIIGDNEIGFYIAPNKMYPNQQALDSSETSYLQATTKKGKECDYVFKLMESPWKEWVNDRFEEKEKAKITHDLKASQKAKDKITYAIGMMQLVNPFIRATVISRCNAYIGSFIDKNTIYCNTDSIFSTVRRPDIEAICGTNLGDFAIEHEDCTITFAEDTKYQINDDIPKAGNYCRGWFLQFEEKYGRKFKLNQDEMPFGFNKYKLNLGKNKVEVISYE